MKITTAEIKMLIKQCVQEGKVYTTNDFKTYIQKNSDKEFTRGQISGALNQLIDSKSIVRVEWGLYTKNDECVAQEEKKKTSSEQDPFQKNMYEALNDFSKKLEKSLNSVNFGNVEDENVQRILEVRSLRSKVEEVKQLFE